MAIKLTPQDIAVKRFEISQLFTPSTPVHAADLFAGRQEQIFKMAEAIAERGRHIILYGERGVGKSSLAQIIPHLIPAPPRSRVHNIGIQSFPTDDFNSVARKIFRKIHFTADVGDGVNQYNVASLYPDSITPDDFLTEFRHYNDNDIPIVVIDEFDSINSAETSSLISNTIKALSDTGANVTLIIVGVGKSVEELIKGHASIHRCLEEIHMPRMNATELREIIEKRLRQLEMSIEVDAKWKIINLSKGLPAYVHGLGKHACYHALKERRLRVMDKDVDAAIDEMIVGSQETFRHAYEMATLSHRPSNLLKQTLTACALAKTDENGYFSPAALCEPMSDILKRSVEIAKFHNHLKDFADPKRGAVLERIGESRTFRFRFQNPAMQPYVIMKAVKEGMIGSIAKQALSYPEQPDLFPSE